MLYYSTKHNTPDVSLKQALTQAIATDGGLLMPRSIKQLPSAFIRNMRAMTLPEIGYVVANTLLGDDIDAATLKQIVTETLNYDIPLRQIDKAHYALELFHGPTMTYKDLSARFMARLLSHFHAFNSANALNVLVATSGDSGTAVANSFLNIANVRVSVLFPKGKLTKVQEAQLTTLGRNVTALEVIGTVDDCLKLVHSALNDPEQKRNLNLSSANSINIGRLLPQTIAYFHAWAALARTGADMSQVVIAVPCGNLGNLTAGLIAKRMGLPIKRFIAAHNVNDAFAQYVNTGVYTPQRTVSTIATALDKGNPSNFQRIMELYGHDHKALVADVSAFSYTDRQIINTVNDTYLRKDYMFDTHSATAYRALSEGLLPGETGIVMTTSHPAKYREMMERITGVAIATPPALSAFIHAESKKMQLSPTMGCFKKYLTSLT